VESIVTNRPLLPNLTFVPLIDSTDDDEVLYYTLIALVLIVIVVFTFIRTSPQGDKSERYRTVSLASSKILVLEEEEEETNAI
jgi:hypothetical protein